MGYPAEPYRIKTVEAVRRPDVSRRRQVLEKAHYNVFLLPQEAVFVDLVHFRGLHAMSDRQWAGMLRGDEAYAGSRNFYHILEQVERIFGKSWVVPVHRGRGALNLLAHGYLPEGTPLAAGPLTELERFHLTRFGATLSFIPWDVGPDGNVHIHRDRLDLPEKGVLYWRMVSEAAAFLPTDLEDLRFLLTRARERGLKTVLNVGSALLAYGPDALRNVLDLADILVFNAREDGLVHTGGLVMGNAEEDYLTFRTFVVVFEGLHTYGGLAGRDMEALARGLAEAAEGHVFHHHQAVLRTLRDRLRETGLPLSPHQGVWGVSLSPRELAPALNPDTAVFTLLAGLYLLSGVRAGRLGKELWLALPLRRYTADHLEYVVRALEALRDHVPLLPDLELLNVPRPGFETEDAHLMPTRPFLPRLEEEVLDLGNIPPYRIKHVEIAVQKPRERREEAIREAGYNTFLLRSEDVYIDLLTDSGTSAQSAEQWKALIGTPESWNYARAFDLFREAVAEVFGMPYVVPTHQGRAAEHILSQTLIRPGQYVINNMYFTTTREHQERAGGIFVDLIRPEAHDPANPYPFKGDLDLDAVKAFIEEKGPENIAYICLEMNVNMAGGQPVSLATTRKLAEIARSYDIPLIFDATRSAENAYFIKVREEGQAHRPVREILRELMSYADGLTFSAKKDVLVNIGGFAALRDERLYRRMLRFMRHFEGESANGGLAARDLVAMAVGMREMVEDQYIRSRVEQTRRLGQALLDAGVPIVVPVGGHAVYLDAKRFLPHLEQKVFPAQRLAAEIYVESGVRTMERGTVSAGRDPKTGDHRYPKLELVRVTLPRRVYTASHMDVVVEGILGVWERRESIPGLRMVYEPPTLRFFTARFESL